MTLDEAIKHAEEVVDKKEREKQKWEKWLETDSDYRAVAEKVSCELCAEEHRQLAEWLKDYKRLLEQEPCDDAISRQAVTDTTICDGISCNECSFNTCEDGQPGCLLKERVDKLPSVNPQEKTGHWIRELIINEKGGCIGAKRICSECGNDNKHDEYMNYCPNCGCRMVEPQERKVEE